MGIDGVIILDKSGRPLIQSGIRSHASSYAQQHIDVLNTAYENALSNSQQSVDPVLLVESVDGPSVCCHVQHGSLRIACPVSSETDPLFVFAFLRTLLEVLQEYLGEVSAGLIAENFDVVYQLLEEMLDSGYPLTTEPNALRDIVTPPSFFKKILAVAGSAGIAKVVSTPFSSPIPWRATGLRYNTNEIFFDLVEDLDCILSKQGKVLSLDVWGKIKTNTRLTGTPDILLTFNNPQAITDCSFHPCVRLPRWARDKALSFVPPDGKFTLMEYRFGSSTSSISPGVTVPFALKSSVELLQGSANFELTLQPQSPSPKGLEMIAVEWYLGKGVSTASCIVTGNQSSYTFDARMALLRWQIAPATRSNTYILRGTFNTSLETPQPANGFQVAFSQADASFSALKIQDLKVTGEAYKPFRGFRSHISGKVEVRW